VVDVVEINSEINSTQTDAARPLRAVDLIGARAIAIANEARELHRERRDPDLAIRNAALAGLDALALERLELRAELDAVVALGSYARALHEAWAPYPTLRAAVLAAAAAHPHGPEPREAERIAIQVARGVRPNNDDDKTATASGGRTIVVRVA
jgi:hypothetical protein